MRLVGDRRAHTASSLKSAQEAGQKRLQMNLRATEQVVQLPTLWHSGAIPADHVGRIGIHENDIVSSVRERSGGRQPRHPGASHYDSVAQRGRHGCHATGTLRGPVKHLERLSVRERCITR